MSLELLAFKIFCANISVKFKNRTSVVYIRSSLRVLLFRGSVYLTFDLLRSKLSREHLTQKAFSPNMNVLIRHRGL